MEPKNHPSKSLCSQPLIFQPNRSLLILRKKKDSLRIQVCPKEGITPTFLFFSDGNLEPSILFDPGGVWILRAIQHFYPLHSPWYFPWWAGPAGFVVQSAYANCISLQKWCFFTPYQVLQKSVPNQKQSPTKWPCSGGFVPGGGPKMPMIRSNIFFVGSSDSQQKHEQLVCQPLLFCRELFFHPSPNSLLFHIFPTPSSWQTVGLRCTAGLCDPYTTGKTGDMNIKRCICRTCFNHG